MDGNAGTIVWGWALMAGWPYTGECHQQANLMNLAIQLIGVAAGREYLLRASTDGANVEDVECKTAAQLGITQDLDGDGQSGNETLCLYFDYLRPPNPPLFDINAFEGTLDMPWQHYTVWPSFKDSNGCQLLLQLLTPDPDSGWAGADQYWMLMENDNVIHVHPNKVPGPTSCP